MAQDLIKTEITLGRAPDDPPEYNQKYQDELTAFARSLDAAGVEHSQWSIALHTADAGGWPVGHFALSFGPPAIAALAAVTGAWLQARYGRKIRLKVGDVEAEARTMAEIKQLLEQAAAFRGGGDKVDDNS